MNVNKKWRPVLWDTLGQTMKIVFVCSGNTCRSPLAWAAWQKVLREIGPGQRAWLDIETASAGLQARAGARASANARRVAASWDVDLSAHRARPWDKTERADWLVTMTGAQSGQLRFVLQSGTIEAPPRVRALGEWVPRGADLAWAWPLWDSTKQGQSERDIFDPYGGSLEAYEECGARILRGVRALAEALGESK